MNQATVNINNIALPEAVSVILISTLTLFKIGNHQIFVRWGEKMKRK